MQRADALMARIQAMPNSTCMFVSFTSTKDALNVLKMLSFVKVESGGLQLPSNILCEVYKTTTGASVVIGGTLSSSEYQEMFEVFNKHGKIRNIALPKSTQPTMKPKTIVIPAEKKKPAWKFW